MDDKEVQAPARQPQAEEPCCLVTRSDEAQMTYIIPLTANNSLQTAGHDSMFPTIGLAKFCRPMVARLYDEIMPLLLDTKTPYTRGGDALISLTDYALNLVPLHPQLHWYWDHAFFGLRPMPKPITQINSDDSDTELIRLEWNWLPKKLPEALSASSHVQPSEGEVKAPHRTVNLDSEGLADFIATQMKQGIKERPKIDGASPAWAHFQSGYMFDFRVAKEDAPKVRALLQLRWLMACMACISGASECVEHLRDGPPDDYKEVTSRLFEMMLAENRRWQAEMRMQELIEAREEDEDSGIDEYM